MHIFWPRWTLESSKHAPAWQAGDERWSLPALPGCLAGFGPRGQGTRMDGPVAGSLLPRWLTQSAGSPPGGVAPWRQAMIGYANFHLLPPWHLWTVWRNERVVVLEPGWGCMHVLGHPFREPIDIKHWQRADIHWISFWILTFLSMIQTFLKLKDYFCKQKLTKQSQHKVHLVDILELWIFLGRHSLPSCHEIVDVQVSKCEVSCI